ncbi:MAG: TonB-dependent receptor [Porphyromonadaceae bacterium]|nr:MAG: TonB-dependent receptor [Porphyromonadaceae bacterium]
MKKTFLTTAALVSASCAALAATAPKADTAKVVRLQNVEVTATRATKSTPVAFTNVSKQQIAELNHGKDIPFLVSSTPSVLTTSDAGAGIGYSAMRVRGTDATRINVTANDIPMNDAESHSIFWVNTPDFASSLEDIQIQRGVGTSTNGAGAFGASVNMRTQRFSMNPYAEMSGTYGSFNTNKETFKVGSGLIGGHWNFDARFSHIASDGYRDRASSKLHSYFAQAGYFGGQTSVRFITFGGKECTYHAWDGISKSDLTDNRKYNPNGEIKRDGKVIGFYDDQTDNYRQTHYQLIWDQGIGANWHWNLGLHYTDGFGYYQEYKNARTLKEYGLEPFMVGDNKVKKSSLVRKKNVDSGFGGAVFSLNFAKGSLNTTFGGSFNSYANDHYGNVIWVENYLLPLDPSHEYYRNKGKKNDFTIYWKASNTLWQSLRLYADMQYRHIGYKITGDNDKWDWTASPEHLQVLNVDEKFDFFNPKVGLIYDFNKHNTAYASFSVAQKEPTRNNYTDGLFTVHPKAEKLFDWEAGYTFSSDRFTAGVNFYYMKYKDQLVLNGKLNEIGEAMAENVPDSYRMGVELQAGVKITEWLRWDLNGTFSRNRIKDYVGYVSNYEASTWNDLYTQTAVEKGNTTIAMSPSFIGNSVIAFNLKGFSAQFTCQYVSRQYLDNFENKEDSLDPYFVSHLNLAYTFKLPHVKAITVGCTVYNIFNEKYETNGYSQTCALVSADGTYKLSSDPRFYPMAGTNVLAHLTFSF